MLLDQLAAALQPLGFEAESQGLYARARLRVKVGEAEGGLTRLTVF